MPQKNEDSEYFDLLPDYVRGDLDEAMRLDFERALKQSRELQETLEREQKIAGEIRARAQTELNRIESGTDDRLAALAKQLPNDETGSDHSVPEKRASGLLGALSFLNPSNWRPAVALSILALGGMATVQAIEISRLEEENYRLASGCANQTEAAVIVEFAPTASWPQITTFLTEEKLSIVKSGAFGTVELGTRSNSSVDASQLERLRQSPLVTSAELAK